jgi:hypothetical protein
MASAATGVVLLAGCAEGGGGEESPPAGPLGDALADVSVTGAGGADLTWVDVPAMLDAAGLPPSTEDAISEPRWLTPVGLAQGVQFAAISSEALGFDPLEGERTISVGTAPEDATRYDGVDAGAARERFEKLGFEEASTDNGDFLALGNEGEVVTSALDQTGAGINRVAIEGDTVVLGGYEEPVAGALGGSPPLSEDPSFAAAADCLGADAFAARIVESEETAPEAGVIGVGLSSPDGSAVPETVCAVAAPDGVADATADCMEKGFAGADPVTGQPFSELLGDAEIETGESGDASWARASFGSPPTDRPVGVVFQMLEKGALGQVLGACGSA